MIDPVALAAAIVPFSVVAPWITSTCAHWNLLLVANCSHEHAVRSCSPDVELRIVFASVRIGRVSFTRIASLETGREWSGETL
jgi:hypothetical protein